MVANLDDKDVLLALDPAIRELRPLITEAWRCQAPKGLVATQ